MKNQIRAFIAVDLSEKIRLGIERFVQTLRNPNDGIKWVESGNLHLTLKFLGDIPVADVPAISKAMTDAAASVEPFDLEWFGLGAFPNPNFPKIVWIGCRAGSESIIRLATEVEDKIVQLGYPKENRAFSPHLTLGRIKQTGHSFAETIEAEKNRSFGTGPVSEIVLYSSDLTSQGPIYTKLASAPL